MLKSDFIRMLALPLESSFPLLHQKHEASVLLPEMQEALRACAQAHPVAFLLLAGCHDTALAAALMQQALPIEPLPNPLGCALPLQETSNHQIAGATRPANHALCNDDTLTTAAHIRDNART